MFRIIGPEKLATSLPDAIDVAEVAFGDIDLLICALGYEDRANSALTFLADRGIAVDRAIVLNYTGHLPEDEANRDSVAQLLQMVGADATDVDDMQRLSATVHDHVLNNGPSYRTNIVVDLSAMSGGYVLACLAALGRISDVAGVRVTFLYAEASHYHPSQEEYASSRVQIKDKGSLGLDEGVASVSLPVGMHGSHDPQLRELVVVIPGFSRDRVRAAISYLNPALLLAPETLRWTVGVPHLESDAWREVAMREIHELIDGSVVRLSTFYYRHTYEYLEELYDSEWLESNLSIVFLGSKLQALAVGLFCVVRGGVRVVLSTPISYGADQYTSGTKQVWAVGFEDWSSTLDALASIGTVSVVD